MVVGKGNGKLLGVSQKHQVLSWFVCILLSINNIDCLIFAFDNAVARLNPEHPAPAMTKS